jgi:hypothetical protein
MPVNEKILFRTFQYLFSLKSIIYAILLSAMLRENHAVFWGKKYRFPRGGINIHQNIDPCFNVLTSFSCLVKEFANYVIMSGMVGTGT